MHELHARMTARALTVIFQFTNEAADHQVGIFLHTRFGDLPVSTRDQILHEDPVNLAAEIAGRPTALTEEPFAERVKYYGAEVRPSFEKEAAEFYDKKVTPLLGKVFSGH
jgi:hypothetical protein